MSDESPGGRSTAGTAATARDAWALRLAEVCDVGILVLDAARELTFSNDRARTLLGCATGEQLARAWPGVAARLAASLADSPDFLTVEAPAAIVLEAAGEADRPQRVACEIFTLESGTASGYLLVLQAAEAAASIEASHRQAARQRGMASLARDTAHDLKGHLNVIKLNTELLQRVVESRVDDPKQRAIGTRSAEVLGRELERVDRIVDVLLDRAMLERGSPAPFDAGTVCTNVMELAGPRCRRQHVEAAIEVAPEPARVSGFTDRLHAALLNLVINALDAMPGGGTLTMRVEVDSEVRISVADTGPGLDPAVVERLWRRSPATRAAGAGVGLQVARRVAASHGGRLAYARREGGGAVFTLHLPLAGAGTE